MLKTDEINLDYMLDLILEKSKEHESIDALKVVVRRVIRSSLGIRAKEELLMNFINQIKLRNLEKTDEILECFYTFAREQKN